MGNKFRSALQQFVGNGVFLHPDEGVAEKDHHFVLVEFTDVLLFEFLQKLVEQPVEFLSFVVSFCIYQQVGVVPHLLEWHVFVVFPVGGICAVQRFGVGGVCYVVVGKESAKAEKIGECKTDERFIGMCSVFAEYSPKPVLPEIIIIGQPRQYIVGCPIVFMIKVVEMRYVLFRGVDYLYVIVQHIYREWYFGDN